MDPYISLTDAATYFGERLNTAAWDDESTANKTKALLMATRAIDRLNFVGEKNDEDQERQFPRGDDSTIPDDIQYACAEIALRLLDGVDLEEEAASTRLGISKYADVQSTYDTRLADEHIQAGIISKTAWNYLIPWLRDGHNLKLSRVN